MEHEVRSALSKAIGVEAGGQLHFFHIVGGGEHLHALVFVCPVQDSTIILIVSGRRAGHGTKEEVSGEAVDGNFVAIIEDLGFALIVKAQLGGGFV